MACIKHLYFVKKYMIGAIATNSLFCNWSKNKLCKTDFESIWIYNILKNYLFTYHFFIIYFILLLPAVKKKKKKK